MIPGSDSGSPDMDDDDHHVTSNGKKAANGVHKAVKRNAKQQAQNKEAQHRYRYSKRVYSVRNRSLASTHVSPKPL